MRPTLALVLMGCVQTPEPAAVEVAPPPVQIRTTDVFRGERAAVMVDGLTPGERLTVYGSVVGAGAGECPPRLGGLCLGIEQARVIGNAVAGPRGVAILLFDVPTTFPGRLWLQGFVDRGNTQLALPVVSEPVSDPPAPDADGDGLRNDVEALLGSDPNAVDSDGDGLADPDELAAGSSLNDADSDGDGLLDGEEVALGTSPVRVDSDGDGLGDVEELDLSLDPTRRDTDRDGLEDGEEVLFGADPLDPDTDGDRVNDGAEVFFGGDPTRVDSDFDGLPDFDEVFVYGTHPGRPDTDGDLLADPVELDPASPTDPLDPDTDDDGLDDGVETLLWGSDPTRVDTDFDGLDDAAEVAAGTDPNDPFDPDDGDPDTCPAYAQLLNGTFAAEVGWRLRQVQAPGFGPVIADVPPSSYAQDPDRITTFQLRTGRYRLALFDSFGDGWNGNSLDVRLAPDTLVTNVTLLSGAELDVYFEVDCGAASGTAWVPGDTFLPLETGLLAPVDTTDTF